MLHYREEKVKEKGHTYYREASFQDFGGIEVSKPFENHGSESPTSYKGCKHGYAVCKDGGKLDPRKYGRIDVGQPDIFVTFASPTDLIRLKSFLNFMNCTEILQRF